MSVTLGYTPVDLRVPLGRDSEYFCTLHNKVGDWADGTQILLSFTPDVEPGDEEPVAIVWTADIAGDDATFSEDITAVRHVLDTDAYHVRLIYNDGSGPLLWGRGRVDLV